MIIITGIGRSGTSFAAKLLDDAGANFKGSWYSTEVNAGMEYNEVVRVNQEIYHGRAKSVKEAITGLGFARLEEELGRGVMVKDPRFLMTIREWLDSGFDVEHIIYCRRKYEDIYRSSLKSGAGLGGFGPDAISITSFSGFNACFSFAEKMFFYAAEQKGVPVTIIDFPKSLNDFSEVRKLSAFVSIEKLQGSWGRVRNPDYARMSASKAIEDDNPQKTTHSKYSFTVDMGSGSTHAKLIQLVGHGKKLLEVGCSTGYMSKVFKEQFGCEVTGFERNPDDASDAEKFCANVIVGDIENLSIKDSFDGKHFDVITFGDVLEHLIDPMATLKKVRPLLNPDGYVVASLPNISYVGVILGLLDGKFEYMPLGILDNTHLRFFTKKSIYDMFRNSGYKVQLCENSIVDPNKSELNHIAGKFPTELLKVLKNGEELFTYQYIVKAVPIDNDAQPDNVTDTGKTALDDIIEIIDDLAHEQKVWRVLKRHCPPDAYQELFSKMHNGFLGNTFLSTRSKLKALERSFRKNFIKPFKNSLK